MKMNLADVYLEFLNEFLTVEGFATYYGIKKETAEDLIDVGKRCHENRIAYKKGLEKK